MILLMAMSILSLSSCKTNKESGSEKSETTSTKNNSSTATSPSSSEGSGSTMNMPQSTPKSLTREEAKSAPEFFRLMATFISIGAGTDPDAKVLLDNYIADYKVRTGKMPTYVMIPWGREGEVDCCFKLDELSTAEQSEFITGLRNSMKGRELIQINENAKNRFRP